MRVHLCVNYQMSECDKWILNSRTHPQVPNSNSIEMKFSETYRYLRIYYGQPLTNAVVNERKALEKKTQQELDRQCKRRQLEAIKAIEVMIKSFALFPSQYQL